MGFNHAKHRIESAKCYPYDGLCDEAGDLLPVRLATDPDYLAARAIINDIQDRRSLKWEWSNVEHDVREEIVDTFAAIIRAARSEPDKEPHHD